MKYSLTGQQMKLVDQDTIQRIGIPSMVLMERAALAVADAAERAAAGRADPGLAGSVTDMAERAARKAASILAVCGTGNNGADGIAAGRILHNRGYAVTLLLAGNPEHGTEEYRIQKQIASRLGVPMVTAADFREGTYDVILDALFGIGLSRELSGSYRELVERLGQMAAGTGASVIAVDIPSGIHAGRGAVMGAALPASETVTFGYLKSGLLLYPGRAYAGKVEVADIGFSDGSVKVSGWDSLVWEPSDLDRLPARRADGNKGTFGKLLLIAGSAGMSGAAYLSALAAYRTGAGLVRILTVPENRQILQTCLPEAIVDILDPEQAAEREEEFCTMVEEKCDWADAIVMGPGLGKEPYIERLIETVLAHVYVPLVLDADGLNTVAAHPHLARYFTENIILTPHMGEMSRLTGYTVAELKSDPVFYAREYAAKAGAVCVLKDAATVTADKEGTAYINRSGCSAMAKAGSGDVLAGVIGGLLAQGMEGVEAASCGVYLHGLAGEAAAAALGERCVLARDLTEYLFAPAAD